MIDFYPGSGSPHGCKTDEKAAGFSCSLATSSQKRLTFLSQSLEQKV